MHQGNIWFRRLVRSNRALYKTCPKHTKLLVAKAVVKAVQGQDPPGRYLEVHKPTGAWKEIPYKRALDKTSQALREKDPNPETEFDQGAREAAASAATDSSLQVLTEATLQQAGLSTSGPQTSTLKPVPKKKTYKKRKESMQFQKPSWWSRGTPIATGARPAAKPSFSGLQPAAKRSKTEAQEDDVPLPVNGLQARESSFFNFLSNTGIFGAGSPAKAQRATGVPGLSNNTNMNMNGFENANITGLGQGTIGNIPNNNAILHFQQQQQYFQGDVNNVRVDNGQFGMQPNLQARNSLADVFEPLPLNEAETSGQGNLNNNMTMDQMLVRQQMQMLQQHQSSNGYPPQGTTDGFVPASAPANASGVNDIQVVAAPPKSGLTGQVSDWLTSFFPPPGDESEAQTLPPPQQNLQRGISSALFNLARSPSQFLTNLKSGVTSMFMDNSPGKPAAMAQMCAPTVPQPAGLTNHNHSIGSQSFGIPTNAMRRDSLLDDTEDTPLETQLRNVRSL